MNEPLKPTQNSQETSEDLNLSATKVFPELEGVWSCKGEHLKYKANPYPYSKSQICELFSRIPLAADCATDLPGSFPAVRVGCKTGLPQRRRRGIFVEPGPKG